MKSLKFTITAALAISTLGLVSCGTDPTDGATGGGMEAVSVVSNKITGSVDICRSMRVKTEKILLLNPLILRGDYQIREMARSSHRQTLQ